MRKCVIPSIARRMQLYVIGMHMCLICMQLLCPQGVECACVCGMRMRVWNAQWVECACVHVEGVHVCICVSQRVTVRYVPVLRIVAIQSPTVGLL